MRKISFILMFSSLLCPLKTLAQNSCVETGKKNCVLEKSNSKKQNSKESQHRNILGTSLKVCSRSPMTGWFRDGYCKSNSSDRGNHSVCAEVTDEFLAYSRSQGNDLITPNRRYGFPGLKEGDRWCLCAARVKEAKQVGIKLKVIKDATHPRSLEVLDLR